MPNVAVLVPEFAFCVGLVVTQGSGELGGFVGHAPPHPNPLPRGERGLERRRSGKEKGQDGLGG